MEKNKNEGIGVTISAIVANSTKAKSLVQVNNAFADFSITRKKKNASLYAEDVEYTLNANPRYVFNKNSVDASSINSLTDKSDRAEKSCKGNMPRTSGLIWASVDELTSQYTAFSPELIDEIHKTMDSIASYAKEHKCFETLHIDDVLKAFKAMLPITADRKYLVVDGNTIWANVQNCHDILNGRAKVPNDVIENSSVQRLAFAFTSNAADANPLPGTLFDIDCLSGDAYERDVNILELLYLLIKYNGTTWGIPAKEKFTAQFYKLMLLVVSHYNKISKDTYSLENTLRSVRILFYFISGASGNINFDNIVDVKMFRGLFADSMDDFAKSDEAQDVFNNKEYKVDIKDMTLLNSSFSGTAAFKDLVYSALSVNACSSKDKSFERAFSNLNALYDFSVKLQVLSVKKNSARDRISNINKILSMKKYANISNAKESLHDAFKEGNSKSVKESLTVLRNSIIDKMDSQAVAATRDMNDDDVPNIIDATTKKIENMSDGLSKKGIDDSKITAFLESAAALVEEIRKNKN